MNSSFFYFYVFSFFFLLGATALGKPWPPSEPVSTVLYSSSSLSIFSPFLQNALNDIEPSQPRSTVSSFPI
jgi:hypothetical protein